MHDVYVIAATIKRNNNNKMEKTMQQDYKTKNSSHLKQEIQFLQSYPTLACQTKTGTKTHSNLHFLFESNKKT